MAKSASLFFWLINSRSGVLVRFNNLFLFSSILREFDASQFYWKDSGLCLCHLSARQTILRSCTIPNDHHLNLIIFTFVFGFLWGSPRRVMARIIDFCLDVTEFKLQSDNYIHFRIVMACSVRSPKYWYRDLENKKSSEITLKKLETPFPVGNGLHSIIAFLLKYPHSLICH